MKVPFYFLLICSILIFSCGTKKVVAPGEFEGKRILFSHGGGFAGTYKSYCLLENGQLFKGSKQYEADQTVKDLDKDIATQIFSNYEVLGFGSKKVESYDNLNYMIVMVQADGKEHKLIWGRGQEGSEIYQLFYDNFMKQVRLNNSDDSADNASKN